ncbi:MAG TPA: PEP-CTERM sorting domain-containing protein [Gemmatales bacterium]|mgnify:CR=1 FL=1|nr:PEP-CTERM sorting domain-containing protein [Gemmatales bacterium]HMP60127.1 PEP-CTERM sorting domain-containing protein [Gemmatales bacterium]
MRLLTACFLSAMVLVVAATPAPAQTFLMMPDSTNNRLVLFNPFDGSVVNSNLFGLGGGTQIHAMQVGSEIWISEQIGDRVSRWDFNGTFLGQIGPTFLGGGLDNIRGMGLIGNTVYVTNSGTANGAPGNAVVMFDTTGTFLGQFSTVGLAPSPFGVLSHNGAMLVSSSAANDDIHRFTLAGASLGTFHNTTSLNFAEQMNYASNGDILVAGFSSNNVVRLDATTGALLSSFTASGARGVVQLGNGNILWTNSAGAHVFDGASSTLVYSGGGRYVDFIDFTPIPEPTGLIVLATITASAAGLGWRRRRRRKAATRKSRGTAQLAS